MAPFARQFQKSRWLQLLLAALFMGRALVPAGFMPGQGGLTLCPAYGPVQAAIAHAMAMDMAGMDMGTMDLAGPAGHGGGHAGHDGGCTYSAGAGALATVHSWPPVAYAPSAPRDFLAPVERWIPRGTIVPTRLPRGPPALS